MIQFIVKKLVSGFAALLGVVVLVFFLFNVIPVDPARLTMGQRADVASVEAVRKDLGLDKPPVTRFLYYLNDLSPLSFYKDSPEAAEKYGYSKLFSVGSGNYLVMKTPYLGFSYQDRRKVSDILITALPKTILLGIIAITFASIVGIFLGVIAAIRQFSFLDNSILVTSILGISQPSYFSGIVLALIFGDLLADYTGLNYTGNLYELNDYGDEVLVLKNLILPAIALGIRPISIFVQLTRSSVLDVLSQDYVRTAKAKGLSYYVTLFKHVLRNALNPVITAISGWFASILAGSYFIEYIFNYKGLGYETIKALESFNFPVVMGSVLFTASLFILVNIFVDILYGLLDPRISLKA